MSQVPRTLLAYANDSPSGERLGLVSTPDASVSCVNSDHGASGAADRRPSHHAAPATTMVAPTAAAAMARRFAPDARCGAAIARGPLPLSRMAPISGAISASANLLVVCHRSA